MKATKLLGSVKQWIASVIRESLVHERDFIAGFNASKTRMDCKEETCVDGGLHYPASAKKSAVKSPANCSDEEINNFVATLQASGTVDGSQEGIRNLVRRAEKLAFLYDGNMLVGVAALKHPRKSYVNRIGAPTDTLEIGWFYVVSGCRSFSRAVWLISSLLKHVGQDVFFTTHNKTIGVIAKRVGFKEYTGNTDMVNEHIGIYYLDYAALQGMGKIKALYERWVNAA